MAQKLPADTRAPDAKIDDARRAEQINLLFKYLLANGGAAKSNKIKEAFPPRLSNSTTTREAAI